MTDKPKIEKAPLAAEQSPERERIVAVARTYFADLNAEGSDFEKYNAETDEEKKAALGEEM